MSDHTDAQTPMLNADGKLRMARFMAATLASAVAIAGVTALGVHAASPEGGWTVAIGIGAMIGFWMCPLAGAVVGNGYHEIATDRAAARVTGAPADDSEAIAAEPMSHAGRADEHTGGGRVDTAADERVSI